MVSWGTSTRTMRRDASRREWLLAAAGLLALVSSGCASLPGPTQRIGDEIIVAGVPFHTGARVVLWSDPGGLNGYATDRPAAMSAGSAGGTSSGLRYGPRVLPMTNSEARTIELEGWSPELLGRYVDQFVIHFDVAGTSRECFRILHYVRGLSVHFMIDLDGTIYQSLDVRERAWHSTISNDRSVGVELANIGTAEVHAGSEQGALSQASRQALANQDRWYVDDGSGAMIRVPEALSRGTPLEGHLFRPVRPVPVVGRIQNQSLRMYDFTPQQYESLARLSATLHRALPKIALDYPREADGSPTLVKLDSARWAGFRGLIGHYHIQDNKVDPGPAFQWESVRARAAAILAE